MIWTLLCKLGLYFTLALHPTHIPLISIWEREKGEREVVCGQVWWLILGICALHLHSSEHTPGAVGSQCCGARGAVGGLVPCSRAPQSWYWRWRECLLFTPPPTIPAGPEIRTHDLRVTSPTLYPLGHDCPYDMLHWYGDMLHYITIIKNIFGKLNRFLQTYVISENT